MEELLNLEMKIISHRANIFGPNPLLENHPDQIDKCIKLGYDVEVDVRLINDSFYLGHDSPDHCVSLEWINERKSNLWIHCKNLNSLDKFSTEQFDLNYFGTRKMTIPLQVWVLYGHILEKKFRTVGEY